MRTTKPLKARKVRSFQGVYDSMEELKEWLKLINWAFIAEPDDSMEELKEWLKHILFMCKKLRDDSMEELKEWLKQTFFSGEF